jgi:hypothetical protein
MEATVTTPHRIALVTAAFTLAVLPSIASAQRLQVPGPDTKRVLVTTFRGDVEAGVKAANEIRDPGRIQRSPVDAHEQEGHRLDAREVRIQAGLRAQPE